MFHRDMTKAFFAYLMFAALLTVIAVGLPGCGSFDRLDYYRAPPNEFDHDKNAARNLFDHLTRWGQLNDDNEGH
jgi:hypothetical protein